MRIVILGAGALGVRTAHLAVARRDEVVIVERDRERIEALGDELDCGFLHGDGTRPAVLREADPAGSDALLCLAGDDQTNIIAGLVGRSLGFPRVVTRVEDDDFEHICIELGLEDTVIPARTIARYLADMVHGHDILELSSAIKGEARIFVFVAREQDAGKVADLALPETTRVTHLYRDGGLVLADASTKLVAGDEVVVVAHREALDALRERWSNPANAS
jgi:trk system potassium uptake protein TrkA